MARGQNHLKVHSFTFLKVVANYGLGPQLWVYYGHWPKYLAIVSHGFSASLVHSERVLRINIPERAGRSSNTICCLGSEVISLHFYHSHPDSKEENPRHSIRTQSTDDLTVAVNMENRTCYSPPSGHYNSHPSSIQTTSIPTIKTTNLIPLQ